MTVKELRDILAKYPDDTQLITTFCSDFTSLPEPTEVRVIPNWDNDYYEKFHPDQFTECKCRSGDHRVHRLTGPQDSFYAYGAGHTKSQTESVFNACGVRMPEVITALHFEGN